MPIREEQVQEAVRIQNTAAHDPLRHVRVVAGPGTGKSSTIEERVRWLLAGGAAPHEIVAVSFTRASALDLQARVHTFCAERGLPHGREVRVSTMHSLALRTLRAAKLLEIYPVDPLVLDDWELREIYDAEFGETVGSPPSRCTVVRREHEAFWSTGRWDAPSYVPADPPVSEEERAQFNEFHGPRARTYSCVLPGELVRRCVEAIEAGVLNPVEMLGLRHLIVDEFQDLNPVDLQFVDQMAAQGVNVFVAGDDDQSVYAFRHASPAGIQEFASKYPDAGLHTLRHCFRSTPAVLAAAQALIAAYAAPSRIQKYLLSLYAEADPPVAGVTGHWSFASGVAESRAIAASCAGLIGAGLPARDILVLLSNTRQLLPVLRREFEAAEIPFEAPRSEGFIDSDAGRYVLAVLRIACNADDYTARRVLMGVLPGIGIRTTATICDTVIQQNMKYLDLFRRPLPANEFPGRMGTAIGRVRRICDAIGDWQAADTLEERDPEIERIIELELDAGAVAAWSVCSAVLPRGATLQECRDYLWADNDEQQSRSLGGIYERLGLELPERGLVPDRLRIMTMHAAKGLSGKVVFIPALENDIFPGPWRRPFPGLVLEAARLLYVSITRARAACYMSRATTRIVHGNFVGGRAPSEFCMNLGGPFAAREGALDEQEIGHVIETCRLL